MKVLLLIMATFSSVITHAQVKKIILSNGTVQAEITPDIGGRLLSFSLVKNNNLLNVGEAIISNPHPAIDVESPYIGYLGHEIWAGPQSQWWAHQTLSPKRAAEKAMWPPDPYITLAKNNILEKSSHTVVLQSPGSPISGLQFTKRYSLIKNKKNSLELNVSARNIRRESVAWDIWFNTRTDANTQLYIPVADVKDVREVPFDSDLNDPLAYTLQYGIFKLDVTTHPVGKNKRKGKILLQPSHGWMASYRGDQLFIIQFERQPQSAIHPEQGQIELYSDFNINKLEEGFLELEVHAPYRTLAENQTMSARELWTVLQYTGEGTSEAQLAFLREKAASLGLGGL